MSKREAVQILETMTWYSEEYPPFNYKGEDGLPTGLAVDILVSAFAKMGGRIAPSDIKIVPWNRSYKYIQTKPGTALFSMTDTPERRRIMKFVSPVFPIHICVIAPKKKMIFAKNSADLGALKIGVVRDDIGDLLLQDLGLNDGTIKRKNSLKQLLYMLKTGRVDALAYAWSVFGHAIKNSQGDPDAYEIIMILKRGKMGYAFHQSTRDEVLAPLQKAINDLDADGTVQATIEKYR